MISISSLIDLAKTADPLIKKRAANNSMLVKQHKKKKKQKTMTSETNERDTSIKYFDASLAAKNKSENYGGNLDSAALNSDDGATAITYPYEVNDDDHCETPAEAYAHLKPMLIVLARVLCKTRATLRIYDPYFCEGSVVERLQTLGFTDVYNKKEDFYLKIAEGTIPEYDCLVTNPPYSADHVERLMKFCMESTKPFFLLLPNYVYCKPYFMQLFNALQHSTPGEKLFYIAPKAHRYLYSTPKGRRQRKSGKYTAPFPTFWYCRLSVSTSAAAGILLKDESSRLGPTSVCFQSAQLPIEVLCDDDPRRKKIKNAQKRKKNKLRKKKSVDWSNAAFLAFL